MSSVRDRQKQTKYNMMSLLIVCMRDIEEKVTIVSVVSVVVEEER